MNKYYIGKATIAGERREIGATLANFRGTVEQAAQIIAETNPGLEDLEVTENGDDSSGRPRYIVPPKPIDRSKDFAEAMMRPPRTVKVGKPVAAPANPHGKPFDPAAGIPTETVPSEHVGKVK